MAWNYNQNMNMQENTIGVSSWHSAPLINQRLHNIWLKCERCRIDGDIAGLNDCLDVAWTEFYADATPEDKTTFEKIEKDLESLRLKLRQLRDKKKYLFHNSEIYKIIKFKWLFLKTLEKKQGLGKKYLDEDEDDID